MTSALVTPSHGSRNLRRALTAFGAMGLLWLASGCSENLGAAPPDGSTFVPVVDEEPTGPLLPRSGRSLVVSARGVVVGTDAGLFALPVDVGANGGWGVVHAGLLTGDGIERVASVDAVAGDARGERLLHVGRVQPIATLVASEDGGRSHQRLSLPDPLQTRVAAIGVADRSAAWPDGAWLTAQGLQVHVRPLGSGSWEAVQLPRSPDAVLGVDATTDGRLLVRIREEGGERVWATARGGLSVVDESPLLPSILAALPDDGQWLVAQANGVDRGTAAWLRWPGVEVEQARLSREGAAVAWVLVGRGPDGRVLLSRGRGPGQVTAAVEVEGEPVEGSLDTSAAATALLVRRGGEFAVSVHPGLDSSAPWSRPLLLPQLDLQAVAVSDPTEGIITVGRRFSGDVFLGPAHRPEEFASLGVPPLTSQITALAVDPDGRILAGSFGTHRFDPEAGIWTTVNTGQSTYQPGDFGGPVVVGDLTLLGNDLWLGADNGDGTYRGREVAGIGLLWERLHAGLGDPGSFRLEFGLPRVTQARAFATGSDGSVWMGGFRGGVWRLDPSTLVWEGRNLGLPDLSGVPMDSCCAVPGEREIDARDLVSLDDGTLFAATAWGVSARSPGAPTWQPRSTGLADRDVFALAVHPDRPGTIAAGVRPSELGRPWLYLSEDEGGTWFPVAVSTLTSACLDLVWSRPSREEIVAILESRGAVRVEVSP